MIQREFIKEIVNGTISDYNDIIAVAKSQVGYTEDETGTIYGAWFKKQTSSSYDFTTAPWCAMFISWCADKAGIGSDIIPITSLSKYSASVFKNNGTHHKLEIWYTLYMEIQMRLIIWV